MKSDSSSSLARKIKNYSTLAGAFLSAGPLVYGAVICSDINESTNTCGGRVFIDMNGDNIDDFVAVVGTAGGEGCHIGTLHPFDANAVAASTGTFIGPVVYNGEAAGLPIGYNYVISYGADVAGNNFLGTGSNRRLNFNTFDVYGNWIGNVEAYVGVRFEIGGNTHYGWIHVNYTGGGGGSTHNIEVLDIGYEDTPEMNLQAGVCPEPGEPIPTVGEWGLIILLILLLTFGTVAIRRDEAVKRSGAILMHRFTVQFQNPSIKGIIAAFNKYFKSN